MVIAVAPAERVDLPGWNAEKPQMWEVWKRDKVTCIIGPCGQEEAVDTAVQIGNKVKR